MFLTSSTESSQSASAGTEPDRTDTDEPPSTSTDESYAVASAERSFSKLKMIKNYLRSSMSQERLSGFAIMSINHDVGKQISYDDIIDDFSSRKCRKGHF